MSIPFTWIYLIYDPYTRLFKIGKSDNPNERVKQLSNPKAYGTIPAAPTDYWLVEAWLCPESREAELHEDYRDYRIRGEWFDLYAAADIDRDGEIRLFLLKDHFESRGMENYVRWCNRDTRTSDDLEYYKVRVVKLQVALNKANQRAALLGYAPLQLNPAPDDILDASEVTV